MAVITIIGILLALILAASIDADKQAKTQATQALIQKLDTALSDRFDALMQSTPTPTPAHGYMGSVYNQGTPIPPLSGIFPYTQQAQTLLRAQVIATFDYIKSELPDTFFVDPGFYGNSTSYSGPYPFNFTGVPFFGTATAASTLAPPALAGLAPVVLPLGNSMDNAPANGSYGSQGLQSNSTTNWAGTGIYGASYIAASGLYKNLGYLPQGYDGADNNGNGLIDEWAEGIQNDPAIPSPENPTVMTTVSQLVRSRLGNHKHNTARSEMLYALLVEGAGPWGAAFSRDDFSDKEVQDTDGDGLPEFVDGWGQPLQFFRWPVLYHSDYQRGQVIPAAAGSAWTLNYPYSSALDQREVDPLDQNQQLTAPGWWSITGVGGLAANNSYPTFATAGPPLPSNSGASLAVQTFGTFFHRLTEPKPVTQNVQFFLWDRGGSYRRAFYTKFLILSAGPNSQPGVFLYSDTALQTLGGNASLALIANENNAMQFGLDVADFTGNATIQATAITGGSSNDPANPNSEDIQNNGQDDITNHNIASAGGLGGPGS
jgi:hypothetical protein